MALDRTPIVSPTGDDDASIDHISDAYDAINDLKEDAVDRTDGKLTSATITIKDTAAAGDAGNRDWISKITNKIFKIIRWNETLKLFQLMEDANAVTFTVDASTNVCTAAGHGYLLGRPLVGTTTGTLPAGISLATTYYAGTITTDTFKIYPTLADANASTNAIDITSTGSGTHTFTATAALQRLQVGAPSASDDAATKTYTDTLVSSIYVPPGHPKRNIISRAKMTTGLPAFLSVGTGLVPQLLASATDQFIATAANGFKASGVPEDRTCIFTSNQNFPTLVAGSTNYLYVDIDANGAGTLGASVHMPGDGYSWNDADSLNKILTHLEASPVVDEYGNFNGTTYWTLNSGAVVNSGSVKFGTNGVDLSSAGRYLSLDTTAAGVPQFDADKWGIGFWVARKTGAGSNGYLMALYTASPNVVGLGTGTGFTPNPELQLKLVTTGSVTAQFTNNLATAFPLDTYVWVAINFDKSKASENYTVHVAGTKQAVYTSTNKIDMSGVLSLAWGIYPPSPATTAQPQYLDDIIILNGYNVPTAAPSGALVRDTVDSYDINRAQMRSSNDGVAFTERCRVYVGEADTNASAVTAVRPYAIRGIYDSGWQAYANASSFSINSAMGTKLYNVALQALNLAPEGGFNPGEVAQGIGVNASSSDGVPAFKLGRTTTSFRTQTNLTVANASSTAITAMTDTKWKLRKICERAY